MAGQDPTNHQHHRHFDNKQNGIQVQKVNRHPVIKNKL